MDGETEASSLYQQVECNSSKEASSSEDELDNDTEDFNPQESNKDDSAIQLDDEPTNSSFSEEEPLGDNVRKTLREMKEMMKALCEKIKKNEKCLKEIKDLQQRLDLIIFCTHYLFCYVLCHYLVHLLWIMIGYARHVITKIAVLRAIIIV